MFNVYFVQFGHWLIIHTDKISQLPVTILLTIYRIAGFIGRSYIWRKWQKLPFGRILIILTIFLVQIDHAPQKWHIGIEYMPLGTDRYHLGY